MFLILHHFQAQYPVKRICQETVT